MPSAAHHLTFEIGTPTTAAGVEAEAERICAEFFGGAPFRLEITTEARAPALSGDGRTNFALFVAEVHAWKLTTAPTKEAR